jgi:hypothetical protein
MSYLDSIAMGDPRYSIEWDAEAYFWDDLGVFWDGLSSGYRAIIRNSSGASSRAAEKRRKLVDVAIETKLCYVNGDPYITGNSSEGNGNVVKIKGVIEQRYVEALAVQLASGVNTVNLKVLDIQKTSRDENINVSANIVVNNTLKESVEYELRPIIKAEPVITYNR